MSLLPAGCAPETSSFGAQSTVLRETDGAGGGATSDAPLGPAPSDDASSDAEHAVPDDDPSRSDVLVAFDDEGRVLLVDPGDGRVLARRDLTAELGKGLDPVDLVVDPLRSRLVVVACPPPFEESVIFEIPLDDAGDLGAPRRLGRVVGEARAMPIDGGIVVASNEDGPRVRLMRDDGERTRGRPLPPPLSWWSAEHGARIEGLGADADDRLVFFGLEVGPTGSIEVVRADVVGGGSEDARLVREVRPLGGQDGDDDGVAPARLVLHDEETGLIRIAGLPDAGGAGGASGSAPRSLAFGARNLEAAIRWGGAVAIATSMPDTLIVVDPDGESAVALPGRVRSGTPFGRHDLAVASDRLFVATARGIVSFRRADGDGSVAETEPAFAGGSLRGPIAVVARP